MRIAIIDDEPSLIKLAGHTISDYGKKNNLSIEIDEYLNGEDFLNKYTPGKYTIIFMDVYMPGMTGIETVLKLREVDSNVTVIFLTTSESHMKDALSCHAFDYLVKPANRASFFKVLDDCIKFLGTKNVVESSKYIEFKSKGVAIRLPSKKVLSVSSNAHYVTISTKENSYEAKETFASVADILSECRNFLLINRGIYVNMDYITSMDESSCELANGEVFSVKVKGAKSLLQSYSDYCQSIQQQQQQQQQ